MKKFLLMLILSLFILISLTGCTWSRQYNNSASTNEDILDKILAEGKITIGVNPPGEPICFYDDLGNLIGYDVDWANKLGEVLGVEVELIEVSGENRISAVTSGRVDVIFANITANLERAKSINFSIPYLKTGIKMATRVGLEDVNLLSDLNDAKYTIALASGSTSEQLVLNQAPNCTISYVANFADQCLSLKEGKVDAILEDGTSIDYMASKNDFMVVKDTVYTSDPICIGYAKGNPNFSRYLDMFVSNMITSGWQEQEYYKWFGSKYTGVLNALW